MAPPVIASISWLLCMAAAIALLSGASFRRDSVMALIIAFAATLLLAKWLQVDAASAAFIAGLAAASALLMRQGFTRNLALAGVAIGLAATVNQTQGVSLEIAAPSCVAIAGLSLLLGWKRPFLSAVARQRVMMIVAWIAPIIAATPGVMSGWRSAQALNLPLPAAGEAIPLWTIGVLALALGLGCLRGAWGRK